MNWRLFRALDDEWRALSRSATRAGAWSDDGVLGGWADAASIVAFLHKPGGDPSAKNQVLAALARRAPSDDLAMRTMLQALLPGLVNVAKRLAATAPNGEELEAQVLTEAVARIRRYPLDRRPRSVAANVTLDVFGAIVRDWTQRRTDRTSETVPGPFDLDDPSAEVVDLVMTAWSAGRLARRDARLLLSIAVGNDTLRARAAREGVSYGAMTERWRRARNRLRRAVLENPDLPAT